MQSNLDKEKKEKVFTYSPYQNFNEYSSLICSLLNKLGFIIDLFHYHFNFTQID